MSWEPGSTELMRKRKWPFQQILNKNNFGILFSPIKTQTSRVHTMLMIKNCISFFCTVCSTHDYLRTERGKATLMQQLESS